MQRDPRIDEKIAAAAPFARPVLDHLRALVHRAIPEAGETIKWGMPHFTYKGKNVAGMAAFKAYCALTIHGDGRQGEAMGQFGKITGMDTLPGDDELIAKLQEACARIDEQGSATPKRAAPKKKHAMEEPAYFTEALAGAAKAREFWATLAPSHRFDYLEWITEAKREETREKRMAQALEWLGEGKRRNWKYE